jgi:Trk-type K+ transport system membrane component
VGIPSNGNEAPNPDFYCLRSRPRWKLPIGELRSKQREGFDMKRSMRMCCFVAVMAIVVAGLIPVQQAAADEPVTVASAADSALGTVGVSSTPAPGYGLPESEPIVIVPSLGFPIND